MLDNYQAHHHTGERISTPLTGEGFVLMFQESLSICDPESQIYKSMNAQWNTKEFSRPRKSINIGETSERESFTISQENELHIYNMPIKIPGSLEYKIPKELSKFKQTIQKIINYQHTIKNTVIDDYSYISVDQSWVLPNDSQRKLGAHTDDMQGPRYPTKLPPNQTYIVSNILPTKIYPQPFLFYDFNPNEYDLSYLIHSQADESQSYNIEPFSIHLYDSYTIHNSNINNTPNKIWRTLLRIEFTQKVGDEISNTRNPLFADHLKNWIYRERNKPGNLKKPEL